MFNEVNNKLYYNCNNKVNLKNINNWMIIVIINQINILI